MKISSFMSICIDCFDLLELCVQYPKTNSQVDTLYVFSDIIKASQTRLYNAYFIEYDWNYIFSTKNPVVMSTKENNM